MKKTLRIAGVSITILVTISYLVSSLTPYISPNAFPVITLFSLAYLPVLVAYILLIIAWAFTRKKIALLLFILFFAGYENLGATIGFNVLDASWNPQKDSNTLRIMCWNVNYLGDPYISHYSPASTRNKILAYIKEIDPDILCLQDFSSVDERSVKGTFYNNMNDVLRVTGFKGSYFPFFYEHNGYNYAVKCGVAFFTKLPVIDSGSFRQNGEVKDERAGYIDIMMENKPIRIYAAHLSSMNLWPNDQAGINYLEGDSTRQRTSTIISKLLHFGRSHAREAETIKKEISKSPYPVLLSADLNSVPSSHVYHALSNNLEDAFLENDYGIGGTYNRVFPKLRIDVLLHSKEIEVVQYTRPAVDLSDHYPIIADIRWKK